jgi:hypothetical protein
MGTIVRPPVIKGGASLCSAVPFKVYSVLPTVSFIFVQQVLSGKISLPFVSFTVTSVKS